MTIDHPDFEAPTSIEDFVNQSLQWLHKAELALQDGCAVERGSAWRALEMGESLRRKLIHIRRRLAEYATDKAQSR